MLKLKTKAKHPLNGIYLFFIISTLFTASCASICTDLQINQRFAERLVMGSSESRKIGNSLWFRTNEAYRMKANAPVDTLWMALAADPDSMARFGNYFLFKRFDKAKIVEILSDSTFENMSYRRMKKIKSLMREKSIPDTIKFLPVKK
jgi:hypothetical protein